MAKKPVRKKPVKRRKRKPKKTEEIVRVEPVSISDLLKTDYLSYAVSSAVRAIPSSHDGLTPSSRRALYIAMYDMPTDKLVKAAYMVGSILKLHPLAVLAGFIAGQAVLFFPQSRKLIAK